MNQREEIKMLDLDDYDGITKLELIEELKRLREMLHVFASDPSNTFLDDEIKKASQ